MVEQIADFLKWCYWSPQEIEYVRPHLPRWERHLRRMGVTVIPSANPYWSEEEDRAHDHLFLLMMQAGHGVDPRTEHRQRNLTGVRPHKA
jgi:hypothetical protein